MTTTSNSDCKTGLCHYDSASRTKFFNGMLLTDEHLRAEQLYHRQALKRMNRYIWGAGIVCGLNVEQMGFCVKVHPGFALDCDGNSIEVCRCITVDMTEVCKDKFETACVPAGKDTTIKTCLTIRYKEIDDDSVAVLTPGDDCSTPGKTRSQASRVREGFCFEFSDCPTTTCRDHQPDVIALLFQLYLDELGDRRTSPDEDACMKITPVCPTCGCDDHECGVCLANLEIDCAKRTVKVTGACRRYVMTPRLVHSLADYAAEKLGRDQRYEGLKAAASRWVNGERQPVETAPKPRRGAKEQATTAAKSAT